VRFSIPALVECATDSLAGRPHDIIRDAARELMKYIEDKSVEYDPERKVLKIYAVPSLNAALTTLQLSLVLEYIAGKTTDSLDRLIALYRPDSLVVGSRGRRWHAIGMGIGVGSISR
jgi:hypothetical protein